MTNGTLKSLFAALLALGATASVGRADSITLRPGATARADGPITLGDVAMLVGEAAQSHAGVVIIDDAAAAAKGNVWIEVTLTEVSAALKRAGVNPGPIALSGSRSVVRLVGAEAPAPPAAGANREPERTASVVAGDGPATVRLRVAEALARLYGVGLSDMRLLFDDRDEAFLDQLEHGRRIAVLTPTSSSSSRMVVGVRLFVGDSMTDSRSITVSMEIRREVLVMTQDVAKRAQISAEAVRAEPMWVEAGGAALITDPAEAVRCLARTDLKIGTVLRADAVDAAVLVRRGALVHVNCLSGGILLRMQARALGAGRRGDIIEVRRDGSDGSFMARVDGENLVIVDLGGAPIAGG